MEKKLISIQDIIDFKPISINTNEAKKLDPFILEAQEFDIRPILGDPFFLKVLDGAPTFTDVKINEAFNGLKYTFEGYEYEHKGIKASLIYFAYARYLTNSNSESTAFGMVVKKNEYSDPISDKKLSMMIQQAKAGAIAYKVKFEEYLNRNSIDFPLWKINCSSSSTRKSSTRIKSISKN